MHYLVAIHRPANYDPAVAEDASMGADIDALNAEMVAAGVRVYVGGLQSPELATSLRSSPNGAITATPGPYLPTGEQVGGFWVLDVASEAEALEWGRKAVRACRAPVEVRPFHSRR